MVRMSDCTLRRQRNYILAKSKLAFRVLRISRIVLWQQMRDPALHQQSKGVTPRCLTKYVTHSRQEVRANICITFWSVYWRTKLLARTSTNSCEQCFQAGRSNKQKDRWSLFHTRINMFVRPAGLPSRQDRLGEWPHKRKVYARLNFARPEDRR